MSDDRDKLGKLSENDDLETEDSDVEAHVLGDDGERNVLGDDGEKNVLGDE